MTANLSSFELGYDIPALPGMRQEDIYTPALIIDLDAFEDNIERLRAFCAQHNVRHRAHAKMHRSVDVARFQIERGGACGICCQKVSEAEVFARAGITDILISNQVTRKEQLERLARLAKTSRILVCADDAENIGAIAAAAAAQGVAIEVLVEIDVGAGRCGVQPGASALALAQAVTAQPALRFSGLQAYHGPAQHYRTYEQRKAAIDEAIGLTKATVDLLAKHDLHCDIVAGAGTGTFMFEGVSGVYNELQAGSYAFMDASYAAILDKNGSRNDEFRFALQLQTTVMSKTMDGQAVCDAGLKSQTTESGLPLVWSHPDVTTVTVNDEHAVLSDPGNTLAINDTVRLIASHCDPTCNLHDWYVGVRDGVVETLWPVSARGKSL